MINIKVGNENIGFAKLYEGVHIDWNNQILSPVFITDKFGNTELIELLLTEKDD